MNLATALATIPFIDKRVGGHGTITPVGVTLHHTVGAISAGATASLNTVIKGRTGINGPLCNIYISREPKVYLISDGKAYHAGLGSSSVLAQTKLQQVPVRNSLNNTDGNPNYIGIEIENNGVDEVYSEATLDLIAQVSAALCKYLGKNQNVVIGHREWTTRKVDPRYDMGEMRARVAAKLVPATPPIPPAPPAQTAIGKLGDTEVQTKQYGVTLGADGKGYTDLFDVAIDKFVSVIKNSDGNPNETYFEVANQDGHARIYAKGAANGAFAVKVVSAV